MQGLLAELKRRKVFRAASFYVAGAWAVLQVADIFIPLFGLPEWSMTLVLMLSATGFPIAMSMAWVFDFRSDGVVVAEDPPAQRTRHPFSLWNTLQLLVILILAATVGYLYYERLFLESDSAPAETATLGLAAQSIAVLPFENMSADGANRYFSDGISEELLNALAHVDGLQVAARTSSFTYRDNVKDVITIGRELGVATLLEGSVRKQGNNVRITAQLIDTRNGYHLWSKTYDSPLEDIFALQDDISRQVVAAILPMITTEIRAPKGPTTGNVHAYNAYLKGRARLREPSTDIILANARARFTEAIQLDPKYAEAWAGLCDALLADYRHNNRSNYQIFIEGEKACGIALTRSISSEFSLDVYIALGVLYREAGEYDKALDSLLKAKRINSDSVRVLKELGATYAAASTGGADETTAYSKKAAEYLDKAEQHLQDALQLSEGSWASQLALANFYFDTEDYDEAVEAYDEVLALHPGATDALINKASALNWLGEYEEAETVWLLARDQALATENYGALGMIFVDLGGLYYYAEDFARALDMYHSAQAYRTQDHLVLGRIAECHRHLGDAKQEQENYAEAIKLAQDTLAQNPDNWETRGLLAIYHGFSGHRDEAVAFIETMLDLKSHDLNKHYFASLAYWALRDIENAYAQLEFAARRESLQELLQRDPDLKKLRALDEDRFDDVVDR